MGRVLVTGGAGFIGSHVVEELLGSGYAVRVLDSLCPQVHGEEQQWPVCLRETDAELCFGDVRDVVAVRRAMRGVDAVVHLAARVGVGQSMYEIAGYTAENQLGTAVLLEAIVQRPVRRLVVASSMSVYGEGLCEDEQGRIRTDATRLPQQLALGQWEPTDALGALLRPVPTPESKPVTLASNYALCKYAQEQQAMILGRAYRVPTIALRFFNVYGPRQALSNPYTGVLAIFASRLLNGRPPVIYEDGLQRRDFVSVHDIARACRLALEADNVSHAVINVGSGQSHTVLQLARSLAEALDCARVEPHIRSEHRVGDIRHCFADISLARSLLGYEPQVGLSQGLAELARWLSGQVAEDRIEAAHAELASRGLTSARTLLRLPENGS